MPPSSTKLWADGPAALRYIVLGDASGNSPQLQPYIRGLTESTADFTTANPSKQVCLRGESTIVVRAALQTSNLFTQPRYLHWSTMAG